MDFPARLTALHLGFALPAFAADPSITFERSELAAEPQPFAVAAADLNRDGTVDLAVTHPVSDRVSIYLGRAGGGFETPHILATGRFPRGLAIADFDRDGQLDLAVAAASADGVAIHRGLGAGRFSGPVLVAAGSRPFLLTAGDLNGDDAADLAVALEGNEQIAVLLNDGRGQFATTLVAAGKGPAATAAGDVDGDRVTDLAVASWGANRISVLRGLGAGKFAPAQAFGGNGRGLYAVELVDLDRDGHLDLLWTDVQRGAILVRYGDGRGAFPRAAEVKAGNGLRSVASADLDGDGRLDLIGANLADGTISVSRADGAGGFSTPRTVAVGQHPRMVAAVDANRDGRLDLVTTNMESGDLTLLLNTGTTTQPESTPTMAPVAPVVVPVDLEKPTNIALDRRGGVIIADQEHHRIARADLATGAITNLAGTGAAGSGADGPATASPLKQPCGVAVDGAGNIFVADLGNNRVRRIDPKGTITTVAGTGRAGFSGDGGPALAAELNSPYAVAVDGDDNLYIGDFGNARVRKVDRAGIVTTVLGNGVPTAAGDGGPGTAAQVGSVTGLAIHPSGDLLIADQYNMRIRRLSRAGIVTTIAGTGAHDKGGDGGPATQAQLSFPASVAADAAGNVFISDQDDNRVRKVAPDGTMSTVAGTRDAGFSGDGGPATKARIWFPFGLAPDGQGNLYFSDRYNHCIRKVDAAGVISTVAGAPREKSPLDLAEAAPRLSTSTPAAPRLPAPALTWEHVFFSGSDANAPYAVGIGDGGALYVAGDVGSGADWLILRLSPDGQPQSRFQIATKGIELPHALVVLPGEGGFVAAGEISGKRGEGRDYLIASVTPDGHERWRYQPPQPGKQIAHGLAVDTDGNLYVAGESNGEWEVFSLSADGVLRWTVRDGVGTARGIAVGPDGTLVAVGDDYVQWRVVKMDRDGTAAWRHTVSSRRQGPNDAVAYGVQIDRTGRIVVAGSWTDESTPAARVEALAPEGTLLWAYTDAAGAGGSVGRGVALDPNGNAIVVGGAATDWLLFALDPTGRLLWRTTHDGGGGEMNADGALAVAATKTGQVIVAGIAHPEPPAPPSLGRVQWRVARYAPAAAAP